MPRPSLSRHARRDTVIRRFLPLADSLARRFHRRYSDVLDRDDLIQVARLALVRAAARLTETKTAPAYLKRCISGALCHHLRDHGHLVRLPARQQHALPWKHLSLDAPAAGVNASPEASDRPGTTRLDLLAAPANPPAAAADSLLVQQLMALLQPRQAAALQLTVLDGLSLRQAAQQLGVSAMTVARSRSQAIAQLRDALAGSGGVYCDKALVA
jgi:RNA polymerase sigma factor (sigma-70 family)